MAKIAVELDQALKRRRIQGLPGGLASRELASGPGWSVSDVMCTSGPHDSSFEEQHTHAVIAIVAVGTFEYRAAKRPELMTPGALLLGNPRQSFECSHDHAAGDRCVSFWFEEGYFETVSAGSKFGVPRMPAIRDMAPLVTRACAGLSAATVVPWEELSVQLAAKAIELSSGITLDDRMSTAAVARVSGILRRIEQQDDIPSSLAAMASEARLSRYHFLRTFQALTGLTPHQYLLRNRLRQAAISLHTSKDRVIDIAFECGFGDVSNFNRAFRAEFGVSPRAYRSRA